MLDRLHLCVITDTKLASGRDHVTIAEAALLGGADMIQLRDKSGDMRSLLPQARAIQKLCQSQGAVFIVNDRVDLALAAGADGVHVGQEDLPAEVARRLVGSERILGVSTHDCLQAEAARAAGADYIGFGPMFPTGSKETGYTPRGLAGLSEICKTVPLPILAIGGIS
ncbi:MAG TPA: thiamine phosphate synthase, partial [Candidatus Acidoferrum sp.]|nr:thiamine phosphate synthase [Candidatus Acidoferrum sp.]